MEDPNKPFLGAIPGPSGVHFRVWAPKARQVEVVLRSARQKTLLEPTSNGFFEGLLRSARPGDRYRYCLDGRDEFPDPASRFQPEGVHGDSEIVDPQTFPWGDRTWRGISQRDLVFYELHVGTFSPEGTYGGLEQRLDYLRDLGVTAIELMPLAEFPGRWNWGYDPGAFYAPFHGYGSPDELRQLVDAAHSRGLAVFLDVVYNHFGPDGAYAAAFGEYFSNRHQSSWGQGVDLDGPHAVAVRSFFIDNALYWLREFHCDGLRLDATHALVDDSQIHFLAALSQSVAQLEGPKRYLIAEDCRNEAKLLRTLTEGGYSLDGVWADDFHHQIRSLTTKESEGHFADYCDHSASDIVATLKQGWYYCGQHSKFNQRPRGTPTENLPPEKFILCIQNHDQVGNRPTGARLSHEIPLNLYRAVSALFLFAPQTPLLFMGQEFAATSAFQFFTDHHEELGKLVIAGRQKEFAEFTEFRKGIPNPQDPATFERSKLSWDNLDRSPHHEMAELYRALLEIRRSLSGEVELQALGEKALWIRRGSAGLLIALEDDQCLEWPESWRMQLHTEETRFAPAGAPPLLQNGQVHFPKAAAIVAKSLP